MATKDKRVGTWVKVKRIPLQCTSGIGKIIGIKTTHIEYASTAQTEVIFIVKYIFNNDPKWYYPEIRQFKSDDLIMDVTPECRHKKPHCYIVCNSRIEGACPYKGKSHHYATGWQKWQRVKKLLCSNTT